MTQERKNVPDLQMMQFGAPTPGLKYKELRRYYYDPSDYDLSGFYENHSRWAAGVLSALLPGLGECVNGEWGRGIGKFAASFGMFAVFAISRPSRIDYDGNDFLAFLAVNGYIALRIWSIVDAVNIAKVLNMYEFDLFNLGIKSFSVYPAVGTASNGCDSFATIGLGIAIGF